MALTLQNNDSLLTQLSDEIWLEQDRYLSAALNSQSAVLSAFIARVDTLSGNLQVSPVHLLDLTTLTLDQLNTLTLSELESLGTTHATAFIYNLLTANFNVAATISGGFVNLNKVYSYELIYDIGLIMTLEFSTPLPEEIVFV